LKRNILFIVLFGCCSLALFSQKTEPSAATAPVASTLPSATGNGGIPSLIPLPAKIVLGNGYFTLSSDIQVVADKAGRNTAQQFADCIRHSTGFAMKVSGRASKGSQAIIRFRQDRKLTQLGNEGYQLTVTPQGINITAARQAGLFYGMQTLRQLLPPQLFPATQVRDVAWVVPCVSIEDTPRFAWRGLMLDSGHDFQTKDFVLRFIDLMALHKFNIFQCDRDVVARYGWRY
jgi:hexosaminidase